jgi:acetyltransferase-like isoleucine patch superfamily enzyme
MIIRFIGLYFLYLLHRIKDRKKVKYNGFTILFSFKGSSINFIGNDITINSSFVSNLLGLYQRTILIARYGGIISIGNGTGISGTTIYSMKKIEIGNNCLIGANCKIIDNDFHPLNIYERIAFKSENIHKKAIKIGNNCFIGMNSIILKGTEIGDNSIIGAGSVVSGKFPDNVVVAGNPAKIIKYIKQ